MTMPLPSPPAEPVLTRKRQRSQSMSSETSSTKRAASEEPSALFASAAAPAPPAADGEIDSYMAEQDAGERGIERWRRIDELKKAPLGAGETWYLVSTGWLGRWHDACLGMVSKATGATLSEADVGPVDNSPLFQAPGRLKVDIVETADYELLPEPAWKLFEEWYGPCAHPLPRKVIPRGATTGFRVEVFPPRVVLYRLVPGDGKELSGAEAVYLETSQAAKVSDVIKACAERLDIQGVEPADLRAWRINGDMYDLNKLDTAARDYPAGRLEEDRADPWPGQDVSAFATVEVASLDHGDALVIEAKKDGAWIVSKDSPNSSTTPVFGNSFFDNNKFSSSASSTSTMPVLRPFVAPPSLGARKNTIKRGTMGLVNLGNTCFMNSALQCMAHTQEITEYFLTGVYRDELNPSNPLGMQGAIAEAFGSLLQRLWETAGSSLAPREFKNALQRFAPQFIGYQQHDTQELLAFLLDGLHEDLNRVLKKPYVENPDWEGGGEQELIQLARTTWEGYMKRNDSIIVDLFQGQYKSTLVCPECNKVSITFDPFMYLTLPLPVDRRWQHVIHFIPYDVQKKPLKVPIDLSGNATIRDLKATLGRWLSVEPTNLFVAEIWSHKIYKLYEDASMVTEVNKGDIIVVYELPCRVNASKKDPHPEDYIIVPVYHRIAKPNKYTSFQSNDYFGHPIITAFTAEEAKDRETMYAVLIERYSKWTDSPRELYTWTPADDDFPMADKPEDAPAESTHVTEYRANGDVVVGADDAVVNGVDDKMDVDKGVRQIGPKKELFTMAVYESHMGDEYSSSLTYATKWEMREAELSSAGSPTASSSRSGSAPPPSNRFGLLHRGDVMVCEWTSTLHDYYFHAKEADAAWAQMDEFTHPELEELRLAAEAKKKRLLNLDDCLDEFTREEMLGEDDLWYCPRCKKHQQATKKFELWKMPDILVVHLKRFSNSRMLRDKIDTFVDFPIEGLDLEARVGERTALKSLAAKGVEVPGDVDLDEPLVYDLYAVDEHMGGLGGGHYRAYAKNPEDDLWYHFDDSHVSRCEAKESVNSNAYLLFYRRRSKRPIGGKSREKIEAARTKTPEESGAAAEKAEQLPTPNDSPPHYNYKSTELDTRFLTAAGGLGREKSPFDTPATPEDEDASIYGPANLVSTSSFSRGGTSPSSSNEAELDSEEGHSPFPLRSATFRGAGTPDWNEDSSSRSPASDRTSDRFEGYEDDAGGMGQGQQISFEPFRRDGPSSL